MCSVTHCQFWILSYLWSVFFSTFRNNPKRAALFALNFSTVKNKKRGHLQYVAGLKSPGGPTKSSVGVTFFCCCWYFSVRQAPVQERAGAVPLPLRWRHLQGPQWDGGHHVEGKYNSVLLKTKALDILWLINWILDLIICNWLQPFCFRLGTSSWDESLDLKIQI